MGQIFKDKETNFYIHTNSSFRWGWEQSGASTSANTWQSSATRERETTPIVEDDEAVDEDDESMPQFEADLAALERDPG